MREVAPRGYSLIGIAQSDTFRGIFQLAEQVICRVDLPVNEGRSFIEFHPIDFSNFLIEHDVLDTEGSHRYHSIIDGLTLIVGVQDDRSVIIEFRSSQYYFHFDPHELKFCLIRIMEDLVHNHFDAENSGRDCKQFLQSMIDKLSSTLVR